jgi:hypothetical protein
MDIIFFLENIDEKNCHAMSLYEILSPLPSYLVTQYKKYLIICFKLSYFLYIYGVFSKNNKKSHVL